MVEMHGWRVEMGSRYFKCKCPCPERHMKTVHLTPSDPRYRLNLIMWFRRQSCWEDR